MKITLIDNRTKHLDQLLAELTAHDVTVVTNETLLDMPRDTEFIVSSGGSGYAVMRHRHDFYQAQLDLIRTTSLPFLGICLGAELLHVAYGGILLKRPEKLIQSVRLSVKQEVDEFGLDGLEVHEAHRWELGWTDTITDVELIVESEDGRMHGIRHVHKPLVGFLFHPEVTPGLLGQIIERMSLAQA